MALAPAAYDPDFGVPPGKLLEEYLDEREMSARDFGRRCGRSAKLIVEIIAGKAPIEPETALQFERVLGMSADIWLKMEASYRLHLAKAHELERWSAVTKWADQFPVAEMRRRKVLAPAKSPEDTIRQLLNFFGAGSITACDERFSKLADVSYRHSPSFMSSEGPLLVWLRLGEVEAQDIECKDFDRSTFLKTMRKIRTLTNEPCEVAMKKMQQYSAAAGVAFVIVKPMPGIALSGISRWLTPRKALIQQSLRHMADDHFWFTFFHEAAHLLLHSRKSVFLDGKNIATGNAEEEKQANEWAANFLVPQDALQEFIADFEGTEDEVRSFAREQDIAPGIVVGQLQKQGAIQYSEMNRLKVRFQWVDE
jgi:HTH-type transcriptional regulator/antitoxin HigA